MLCLPRGPFLVLSLGSPHPCVRPPGFHPHLACASLLQGAVTTPWAVPLLCSDIYLMEKELAKEQERNNRHRPPKILEPPSFQEPPPKVGRRLWGSLLPHALTQGCAAKTGHPQACTHPAFLPLQPSRPRYKPPPQNNLLAPKLQFQVRLRAHSNPRGSDRGLMPGSRARSSSPW